MTDRCDDLSASRTDREPEEAQSRPARRSDLFVVVDCAFPLDGAARFLIDDVDEVVFLGRRNRRMAARERTGDGVRLSVKFRSPLVSEVHAMLKRTATGFFLEDAGSKNGTFVNGQRKSGPVPVLPGDLIRLGSVFCVVREHILPEDASLASEVLNTPCGDAMPLPGFPTILPPIFVELVEMRNAFASSGSVTVVGETGAGKEILARAIHQLSRPKGPFVAVSCPGLAPNLVEGQLFGYVRGAYSGALQGDLGLVRQADGGTLFLDEVPDLPLEVQAKMLRVSQEHEVIPLGTSRSQSVDVRFLAATQEQLG